MWGRSSVARMASADTQRHLRSSARRVALLLIGLVAFAAAFLGRAAPLVFAALPPPRADIELFAREGCPRCEDAKVYLEALKKQRPTMTVVVGDVTKEPETLERLRSIAAEKGVSALSVPAFYVRGSLIIGFSSAERTGRLLEGRLDGEPLTSPPLSEDADATCSAETSASCEGDKGAAGKPDRVDVPLLGSLSAAKLGMPLFTIAIGLIDGVNPCAMWVLLFLLSFLVNLKSRPKMLLIAGTFVTISGLAYFAFMAAWLNVFLLIGLSRIVQVALGLVALFVGGVHVKDYFAFKKGISFSIPEAAKPTIYARMRAVVHAEHMLLALASAAVLAVMVNVIELLCTAGLPALYTQVLAAQGFPAWKRYAYLALYNTAYMFDDSIMVTVAVVTLSRRKLQEKGGRQLKLVSGATMLALGLLLILKPQWLL